MVSVLTSKIDLDDVFVVEIDLVSVWRMGVDLVSTQESELTWFCVCSKTTWL